MENEIQKNHLLEPTRKTQVLVVEDDDSLREVILEFLKKPDRDISSVPNGTEAMQALKSEGFDLVVSDLVMPGADGMEVLREAKRRNPDCVVILMTGYASLDSALGAIRGGAYDYLRKPFKLDQLEIVVHNACEKIALIRENQRLLRKLKENMEEMARLRKVCFFQQEAPRDDAPADLADKILETEVLLKQMLPSDFDLSNREGLDKTFQHLHRLMEYRREGLLNDSEFSSIKKKLMPFLQE